jgi:hypothetical protein
LLLASLLWCPALVGTVAQNTACAAAEIQITSAPPYGQNGAITGLVTGVANYQDYVVAPYLYLEGAGWYTKPTFDHPTVSINPDGTFTANVTTGGFDPLATIYSAQLLPAGASPAVGGFSSLPVNPAAIATTSLERYPASLSFAGRSWAVKGTYGAAGPGANYFSASSSDVWSDSAGLHLTVNQHDGHSWATEVILPQHLGYGTYAVTTRYNINGLAANLTFGAFTWDPFGRDNRIAAWPYREIDFEDSRWGNANDPNNSQSVVQPFSINAPHRFAVPDGVVTLTRLLTWRPGSVRFVTVMGVHPSGDYLPQDVVDDWTFVEDSSAGKIVPIPGTEMFHFNLWLNQGTAPDDGHSAEVVITDFSFVPVPEPTAAALLASGGTIAFIICAARARRRKIRF